MYLIFSTLEAAQAAQATIDSNIVAIVREHRPEIVSDRGLIPQNAKTGELDYTAARTTTWCEPIQHGDIWYLVKPVINHHYFVGIDLLNGVEGYIDSEQLPEIEQPVLEDEVDTIDVEVTEDFSND